MSEPELYTDEHTGMRLTIEKEFPYSADQPRITAYAPDGCTLTSEEVKEAIQRLLALAGWLPEPPKEGKR